MNDFFEEMGSQLQDLMGWSAPGADLTERIELTERRIAQLFATLERLEHTLDASSCRLSNLQRLASRLTERVETYLNVADQENAWRDALELDRLRQALASERRQFSRQRQAYQVQKTHLQQLEHQLADLRQEAYFNA